jgi:hypothetical protein
MEKTPLIAGKTQRRVGSMGEVHATMKGIRWLSVNSSWRCDSNMACPTFSYFLVRSQSMAGDAVPGPLAFFALRQQHGVRARPGRAAALRAGASMPTASPMPLDCCPPATRAPGPGRGACRQSRVPKRDASRLGSRPILRSTDSRLPTMLGVGKGRGKCSCHAIMLLAQSEECRGLGRSPKK